MGSKNRIAKYILPIMLEEANGKGITTWVEPFVGGANMIDKVPNNFQRIGIDYNVHTVLALEAIRDMVNELPNEVTVEYYNSLKGTEPHPITSLIRFGASFGGKFETGYARRDGKSMWMECVRNSQKQSPNLQGVKFINGSYDEYSDFENCLIYCDPPYEGTTSYKTGAFDHPNFWDWCRKMSKKNLVFVSEYKAPDDFICVLECEVKTNFASQRDGATHKAVEKLFKFSKGNTSAIYIIQNKLIEMRTCNYRNCNASIEGKRKDCKYCSRLCKQYERVFRKREDISYQKDKKGIYDLIDKYLENEELLKNKSLMDLYKSVYK